MGKAEKLITLAIIAVIAIFLVYIVYAPFAEMKGFIDRGCEPTGTAGQNGIPTTYMCPVEAK